MKLACRRLISLINNTSLVHTHRETGSQVGFFQPLKRANKGKRWGLPMLKPLAVSNSQQTLHYFSWSQAVVEVPALWQHWCVWSPSLRFCRMKNS